MANPKNRWSKARTKSHKANWRAEETNSAACPRCHEPKLPHRVCMNCGTYDGKQVIAVGEEKK